MGYVPHNTVLNCQMNVQYTNYGFSESQIVNLIIANLQGVTGIDFSPVSDTEDTVNNITISGDFRFSSPFVLGYPELSWSTTGIGTFNRVTMTPRFENNYSASIPAQPSGTTIYYYIDSRNAAGCNRTLPPGSPNNLYSFYVGPDVTAPVIIHHATSQITPNLLPLNLTAQVTDNISISSVSLEYRINGGGTSMIEMVNETGNTYTSTIAETMQVGDALEYRIVASDESTAHNTTYHPVAGYHLVNIVSSIPAIVIDLDGTHNSGPTIQSTIRAVLGHADYTTSMPSLLGMYDSVFVCLGVYGAGNHVLSSAEGLMFKQYLDSGGRLYMEGGDTWFYDPQTAVHPYFHITSNSDGSQSPDAGPINGVTGTFTQGMSFEYSTSSSYNSWIDHLIPNSGSYVVFRNGSPIYDNGIAFASPSGYKTIGASIKFGGLIEQSGGATKEQLMQAMLDFFDVGAEEPTPTPSPTPQPLCEHTGDANQNGSVTAADAQMAFGIALGSIEPTDEEHCAADCNSNGAVTAGDAQNIFAMALGLGGCIDPI